MPKVFLDKSACQAHMGLIGDAYRDTTYYKYGTGSMRVTSQGAIRGASGRMYAPETGDFTLEAWIYPLSMPGYTSFETVAGCMGTVDRTMQFGIYGYSGSQVVRFEGGNGNSTAVACESAAPSIGAWSHVVVERYSNVFRCYTNGNGGTGVSYAGTIQKPVYDNAEMTLGFTDADGPFFTQFTFKGYIGAVRMTLGAARYQGNFTPPNAAFPIGGSDPLWSNVVMLLDGDIGGHTLADPNDRVGRLSQYAVPAFSAKAVDQRIRPQDLYYGGRGRVYGTVKNKGTPDFAVYRRVRLIRDRDGVCVGETWSNAVTGNYAFDYVDERERYTVLSYDHTGNYRAVVADNLIPEVIT